MNIPLNIVANVVKKKYRATATFTNGAVVIWEIEAESIDAAKLAISRAVSFEITEIETVSPTEIVETIDN